ncbi:hypothetical protein OBBRIDRAFT_818054 [Obba rivulosa]|uniref:C2H2-type domain-containing protein n=1 Tax=Obba rivulosa TaxID=1052685 RepID=A0A8E2AYH2_9APHY|nr:hypothetical protein OBBRIDRAFT_818054 [Obba rivulosa]
MDNLSHCPYPLVGLFADVNMRELAANAESSILGVNPADIMGDTLLKLEEVETPVPDDPTKMCVQEAPSPELDAGPIDNTAFTAVFPEEAISAIVSVLSASNREQEEVMDTLMSTAQMVKRVPPIKHEEPLVIPVLPLHAPLACRSSLVDMNASPMVLGDLQYPLPPAKIIEPQSPILNAHQGVQLEDLRRRAEEFRQRNPGVELDKSWLQEFAGRLSQRGELIDEYRCYVLGCMQRNKRRDHILVHVGSHVEHRPFQCGFCGMRFLRKNECKRHESSHAGRKPYSCPICAQNYQDRSFVRQDLLKRHMRVTHGVQPDAGSRRRRTLTKEEDYWQ